MRLSFRLAALPVAFGLLAAACASEAQSASAGPGTTKAPEYKITVAGDSISVGLGAKLREHVDTDVVVKVIGEQGTGMTRPATFDWPTRLQQLAREFPPAVLIFSVASNDAQDLLDTDGKVVARFADKSAWDAEYSKRLAQSFDPFKGTNTKIIWIGHVRTADDRIGLVNRRVHRLAESVASSRPWVAVTDLAVLLKSGEGRAERCLMPDGIHLTIACLDEAAQRVSEQLPARPAG